MIIARVKLFILDLLFPLQCLGCGQEGEWLCFGCLNKIECNCDFEITDSSWRVLAGVIVAGFSEDKLLKSLIYKFKYNFIKDLANSLSQLMVNKILILKQRGFKALFEELIIIPVPLHQKRFRWRGFNQAELLAKEVASSFGWQMRVEILKRTKHTKAQMKLRRKKRLGNIKDAFEINNKIDLRDKAILLVDDVLTTGATMEECAKVLRQAGASQVWGLVLCRG